MTIYEEIFEIEEQLIGFYNELEDAKEFPIAQVHEEIVIKNTRFLENKLQILKDQL